jgi:hypothetical protein
VSILSLPIATDRCRLLQTFRMFETYDGTCTLLPSMNVVCVT